MSKMMHLQGFMLDCPTHHTVNAWAHPRAFAGGYQWTQPEVWQHCARTLERGKFDGIFFADQWAPYGTYRGRIDETIKYGIQFPVLEPLLLLATMSTVTERIGLASTMSTTYYPPYMMVRKLSTMDHLTKGRVGWNIVTSFHKGEAAAMGVDQIPHDQRYTRCEEYMEVCYKLWDSWETDAVVMDRETGVFADPQKVHSISHDGRWFKCEGISPVQPSPQGRPVLFQAGSSDQGRDFCAKHADAAFGIQLTARAMKAYRDDIEQRAQEKFGRKPGDIRFIWGIQVIVGETEEQAKEKQRIVNSLVPADGGLALMSGHSTFDLSILDSEEPIGDIKVEGMRGLLEIFTKEWKPGDLGLDTMTVGNAGMLYGRSVGMPQIVGTPEMVADEMERMMEVTGGDGFNITPTYTPGSFDEFVEMVVPELQRRGVHRREYGAETYRDHLFQEEAGTCPMG